jgi:pyruvate/2-oxoglutarate dehydrogenase complex dihydrolipoamide dehydrogenase (E3) component
MILTLIPLDDSTTDIGLEMTSKVETAGSDLIELDSGSALGPSLDAEAAESLLRSFESLLFVVIVGKKIFNFIKRIVLIQY